MNYNLQMTKYLFPVLTGILFVLSACGEQNELPGKRVRPLVFDETQKTIDANAQYVVFTADRSFFGVCNVWEVIGSDTVGVCGFAYNNGVLNGFGSKFTDTDTLNYRTSFLEKTGIEGDWYTIFPPHHVNRDDYRFTVALTENQSNRIRKLILSINAGNTGATLEIIQNNK